MVTEFRESLAPSVARISPVVWSAGAKFEDGMFKVPFTSLSPPWKAMRFVPFAFARKLSVGRRRWALEWTCISRFSCWEAAVVNGWE